MTDVEIRPMRPEDVHAAEQICDDAFYDVDVRTARRDDPEPERRTPERKERWIARTHILATTDPGGCWVAEDATGVIGFATSMVRERVWILATFAIKVGLQGKGVGKRVLAAAEAYGADCDRGLLSASNDPLAVRRYHLSGFALHPQLGFRGAVDRTALPVVGGLRNGTADDRPWMDDLDRELRGGPHGSDHEHLASGTRLVVSTDRSGYAYASDSYVKLIAARDESTATSLFWECLAGAGAEIEIPHVTTANPWAIEIGMQARLPMRTNGYLGVRGLAPPAPYIHDGALL